MDQVGFGIDYKQGEHGLTMVDRALVVIDSLIDEFGD